MNVLLMHVFRLVLLLAFMLTFALNSGIAEANDQNAIKASKTNQSASSFSFNNSKNNNALSRPNTKPNKIKLDYTQNDHTVTLLWQLPENFYLYKDRIRIQSTTPETLRIGKIDLPKGVVINDKTLGKQHVFYDQLNVHFKIYGQPQSDTRLKVQYQGCDGKVCLPLQTRQFPVENDGLALSKAPSSEHSSSHNQKGQFETLKSEGLQVNPDAGLSLINLLALFGLGLLMSLTPCVLPMIPILTSIIAGNLGTRKIHSFGLTLSYIIGMALTYAGLGIGIATLGANFQNLFQTTSLLLVAAFLFVLFGLNMLEIIQIRLPSMPLPSLQQLQNKLQGGNYIGALVMGILASLVVSPCTTAPLIGVLTYIAHTQNYYLGGIGLFILALGMGVPLMLIGIGFGRIVPKAGQWMYRVKQLFAACMFGMAIWLIGRKLPAPIEQWLFVILIVGYTILSGVLRVPRNKKHWLFNVLLYILLIYGIALAFATFNNNKTGYTPYEWFKGPSAEHKHDAIATIETPEKLTQTLKRAEKNNQNILLDYYAKWCSQCHILNEKLKSPNIRKKLKKADIKLYRVDVSDYSQSSQTLLERMNVLGMPTLIFINPKTGQKARIVGQMSHEKILSLIQSNQ